MVKSFDAPPLERTPTVPQASNLRDAFERRLSPNLRNLFQGQGHGTSSLWSQMILLKLVEKGIAYDEARFVRIAKACEISLNKSSAEELFKIVNSDKSYGAWNRKVEHPAIDLRKNIEQVLAHRGEEGANVLKALEFAVGILMEKIPNEMLIKTADDAMADIAPLVTKHSRVSTPENMRTYAFPRALLACGLGVGLRYKQVMQVLADHKSMLAEQTLKVIVSKTRKEVLDITQKALTPTEALTMHLQSRVGKEATDALIEYAKEVIDRYPFDRVENEESDNGVRSERFTPPREKRARLPRVERASFPQVTSADELEKAIREDPKRARFLLSELTRIDEVGGVLGEVAGNIGVRQKVLADLVRKHGTLINLMALLRTMV
ncbi:hypothetical protein HY969_00995 [Candidatus Kaiserbacteria bacterium]|nr:hypothetical protein [Candidatus Kaiserbacteria bacterium]